MPLNPPPPYFPLRTGRYEVAPGLKPLGHDFGMGRQDQVAFQLDNQFASYRKQKRDSRSDRLGKYVMESEYSSEVASAVTELFLAQLSADHPEYFHLVPEGDLTQLDCALTGERLTFDSARRLVKVEASSDEQSITPTYASAWDALCCQVQEDVAVVSRQDGRNWVSALHVCLPSHWRPEDKAATDFIATHAPVPHFEKINQASDALVDAMVERGPFVRFGWAIDTDSRLNRHPDPPTGVSTQDWKSRDVMKHEGAPFYLRVERQVLLPLPKVSASVFLIRTYLTDARDLNREQKGLLSEALGTMSEASLAYKGLTTLIDPIQAWLQA